MTPNAASLYFSQCHALEFESNWLFPYIVLLQNKKIFKILARLFLLFVLKKEQRPIFSFGKQSTQSANEKNNEKLTSAQDHVSYGRDPFLFLLRATYPGNYWKK